MKTSTLFCAGCVVADMICRGYIGQERKISHCQFIISSEQHALCQRLRSRSAAYPVSESKRSLDIITTEDSSQASSLNKISSSYWFICSTHVGDSHQSLLGRNCTWLFCAVHVISFPCVCVFAYIDEIVTESRCMWSVIWWLWAYCKIEHGCCSPRSPFL